MVITPPIEWCIGEPLSSSTIFYNNNSISLNHHTNHHPQTLHSHHCRYGDLDVQNESSRVFSTWFIWVSLGLCLRVYFSILVVS